MDWLSNDILSLVGANYSERLELYDFIVQELKLREHLCPHRIRPVRTTLENQREDLSRCARKAEGRGLMAEGSIIGIVSPFVCASIGV